MTQKWYKLFDMDNNRVIVSRDVLFYEQVFPYSVPVSQPSHSCPLPIVSSSADDSVSCPETESPTLFLKQFSTRSEERPWMRSLGRYKARLVAKGFNQIVGIDYTDSLSPVAKSVTVRIFLAIAAAHTWPIQQLDINDAFLHGYLEEDIFMLPSKGYDVPTNLVCKLQRSLYGLKQASCQWNVEFTLKLIAYGFAQSVHDHCLFVKPSSSGLMAMLVYVDDILMTGPSLDDIGRVKQYLYNLFTIKDIGNARYFLGLEIAHSTSDLYMAQTKYAMDIIEDSGLVQAKSASSPFPPALKLDASSGLVF
ncbi:UNVERIFIED_CONTAM: Retrovirus-related Pol polyprotein from transposon RE1 [Sesamum indicum]